MGIDHPRRRFDGGIFLVLGKPIYALAFAAL
jgi:hypothetical protein